MKEGLQVKPNQLIVVGAIILVIAGTYFLTMPQIEELKAQQTILNQKKVELEGLTLRRDTLLELKDQLPQHREELDRLTIAYPNDEGVTEALLQAQTMVQRAGLAIKSLTPAKAKAGSLPITLNLQGTYGAFDNLMKEFANNLRPVIVKSLSVTEGTDKAAGQVLAEIIVSMPYESKAVASPAPATSPAQ